ncbi:Cell division cycle protein [Dirofilaria immitis]
MSEHFYILMKLLAALITLMAEKNSEVKTKYPHPIVINGVMKCNNKTAYAVLINSIEEVEYMKYGNIEKGFLRTSNYYLSERNGKFEIAAIRYVIGHKLYLNITHHCIPDDRRNALQNCFMRAKHEIRADLRAVRFDLSNIDLENIHYQSNTVRCVDWPYKYPEFNDTDYSDL